MQRDVLAALHGGSVALKAQLEGYLGSARGHLPSQAAFGLS